MKLRLVYRKLVGRRTEHCRKMNDQTDLTAFMRGQNFLNRTSLSGSRGNCAKVGQFHVPRRHPSTGSLPRNGYPYSPSLTVTNMSNRSVEKTRQRLKKLYAPLIFSSQTSSPNSHHARIRYGSTTTILNCVHICLKRTN